MGESFFSACCKHGDSNEQEEKGENCPFGCDSLFHDYEPLFRDAFVEIGVGRSRVGFFPSCFSPISFFFFLSFWPRDMAGVGYRCTVSKNTFCTG